MTSSGRRRDNVLPAHFHRAAEAEIRRLAPDWEKTIQVAAKAMVAGDPSGLILYRLAIEMAVSTCPFWWKPRRDEHVES
jgi:hypothetical protein